MDIMTVSQASEYCRVSPKTIINWIEAGHIKAYKTWAAPKNRRGPDQFLKEKGMPLS
jgi:predicted site-specific integrase-resolvase